MTTPPWRDSRHIHQHHDTSQSVIYSIRLFVWVIPSYIACRLSFKFTEVGICSVGVEQELGWACVVRRGSRSFAMGVDEAREIKCYSCLSPSLSQAFPSLFLVISWFHLLQLLLPFFACSSSPICTIVKWKWELVEVRGHLCGAV